MRHGYETRVYGNKVPQEGKIFSRGNSTSPFGYRRINQMGADRIDKGTSYWQTVQISFQPPTGT